MKDNRANLSTMYFELAVAAREVLGEKFSLVSHVPQKQLIYNIPSENLLDDLKSVLHLKLLERLSLDNTPKRAHQELLMRKALKKYGVDDENAFSKSVEIGEVMDNIISQNYSKEKNGISR